MTDSVPNRHTISSRQRRLPESNRWMVPEGGPGHFATEWRRRGLAMDDVSYLLRHADSRTTSRVYVHLKAVDIRQKMEALRG